MQPNRVRVRSPERSKFATELQEFVDQILDAGLVNAACQVLLKLTSPGVPDIYQGQEIWDFSLVDPDNRRPIDYDLRNYLLSEIEQAIASPDSRREFAKYLGKHPRDNRFKLLVTLQSLRFRQELGLPDVQLRYVPLKVSGQAAMHVVAFAWLEPLTDSERCRGVVIVPRFLQILKNRIVTNQQSADIDWSDTVVELECAPADDMVNTFTGQPVKLSGNRILVQELLQDFPLAILK